MARSVIGWPLGRFHSIYGALTFGGGPIGNCMAGPYRDALPAGATIVARTPECTRFLASVPGHNRASLGCLTNGAREPVGTVSFGVMTQDGLVGWRSAA